MMELFSSLLKHFSIHFVTETIRYVFFAGLLFAIFYVLLRKKLSHKIIQGKVAEAGRMRSEFLYSMSSIVIFSVISIGIFLLVNKGYGLVYTSIGTYGWTYFLITFPLSVIIHDTYFYWTHRMMHHPRLYKHIHLVHHQSVNPSPWAAYSFHPFEAITQGMIGPILVFCMPMHIYTLVFFSFYQIIYNVFGHLSFELFPSGFTRNKFLFWHNTATHHNMHHRYFNYNFTIYFNVWDRLMGTLHPKYDEHFEKIASNSAETFHTAEALAEEV